jgi:hypothetical protein
MEVAFQAWLLGGDQLHMEQTKLLNHIVPRNGTVQLVGTFANSQLQTFMTGLMISYQELIHTVLKK